MKTLEGHRAFPYIAWGTVLLFSLFTYSLISGIQESTAYLAEKTKETNVAVDTFIAVKKIQNQKEIIVEDRR